MNIILVPYAWPRHFAVSIFCAGAGLLAWWGTLAVFSVFSGRWEPLWDGVIMLGILSAVVGGASILAESMLRRWSMRRLLLATLGGGLLSGLLTALLVWAWLQVFSPKLMAPLVGFLIETFKVFTGGVGQSLGTSDLRALVEANYVDAEETSLVSLRYRAGAFLLAGVGTSLGPIAARKAEDALLHLGAGLLVGLLSGSMWYFFGTLLYSDLFLAGAALGLSWGFLFGLFGWGVPDSLYAGWMRVLSGVRYARRIPIDAPGGQPKERFVGHYPRGLDLFLPIESGVQELHISLAVDAQQRYFARGLTLAPTKITRFLEKVDLSYDPRRSAPLETRLSSGDRLLLGQAPQDSELEFIMLPREER